MPEKSRRVSIAELKSQLSRYLDAATSGEDILITRNGIAIARIAPVAIDPDAPRLRKAEELFIYACTISVGGFRNDFNVTLEMAHSVVASFGQTGPLAFEVDLAGGRHLTVPSEAIEWVSMPNSPEADERTMIPAGEIVTAGDTRFRITRQAYEQIRDHLLAGSPAFSFRPLDVVRGKPLSKIIFMRRQHVRYLQLTPTTLNDRS